MTATARAIPLLLVSAASLAVASPASASDDGQPEDDVPFVGGLGKAFIGGVSLDVGNVESSLLPLLGSDAGIGQLGMQLGGGGFGMIGGVVIAGGGYAIVKPTSDGERGDVSLSGGGGGFALGYAFVNNRSWILYPYFGLGGYGYTLEVTNVSGADMALGDEVVVGNGDRVALDAGFWTADFGISVNRLLFFADGGFAVGVDAGFLTSVTSSDWQTEEGATADLLERALLRGAYLRLTLGGGGFFFSN